MRHSGATGGVLEFWSFGVLELGAEFAVDLGVLSRAPGEAELIPRSFEGDGLLMADGGWLMADSACGKSLKRVSVPSAERAMTWWR